jgi:hypothetical protein
MSSYSIDAASIVVDPAALLAAWNKLAKQLEDAFFRGGRPGVIEQLRAVLTFLEAVDSGRLAIPLNALFVALYGLDFGITDPLLKAKDRSGRPRERFSRLILKGQTVATMTIFMEDMQYSRQSAAETTAKILRECGPMFKNVTWREIAGWRDYLRKSELDFLITLAVERQRKGLMFLPESRKSLQPDLLRLQLISAVQESYEEEPIDIQIHFK